MNEDSVAQFLIDNSYHLTALEFFCETFERNGHPVESLSHFFEDSANFLLFEDMRSISEISSTGSDPTAACSDAIRIKDDRIAVLEHECHILRDSLDEANSQLLHHKSRVSVDPPPSVFDRPPDDEEDSVLNQLIARYLKTRCLKLSQLAFNNETLADKLTDRVNLPDVVDLVHLLRIFRFLEQTPNMPEEIEKLRSERDQLRTTVSQLMNDLESARKHGTVRHASDASVCNAQEIMDSFFNDVMQLMNAVDVSERRRMIRPLQSIIKYHPVRETRMQCIQLILNLWEDPDEDTRAMLMRAVCECCTDNVLFDAEVLPVISQLLDSNQSGILCLASLAVNFLTPLCSVEIRASLMLSILKQLIDHPNPIVRAAAARDGSVLIHSFAENVHAVDKMQMILEFGKTLVFDPDSAVQTVAIARFIPEIEHLAGARQSVGRAFCEFWLKQALVFGAPSGSRTKFAVCVKLLEAAMKLLVPVTPKSSQQLVAGGSPASPEVVVIPKTEFEWIVGSLVPQLPKFAPIMFSSVGVKKETDRYVATVCRSLGQKFVGDLIVPEFLTAIEKGEPEMKKMMVSLLLSAVSPSCDSETFLTQSRNFLTYATNELKGFRPRDVKEFIAPAFALLSAAEPDKRPSLFKLVDELGKSSRTTIRVSAVTVVSEILTTLEPAEIEKTVLPVIVKLSTDPDDILLGDLINCVGIIAGCARAPEILKVVRELFTEWFKKKPETKLLVLHAFSSIIADTDTAFQDSFILPMFLDCVRELESWADPVTVEKASSLIVETVYAIESVSDDAIAASIRPIIVGLNPFLSLVTREKVDEIRDRYDIPAPDV